MSCCTSISLFLLLLFFLLSHLKALLSSLQNPLSLYLQFVFFVFGYVTLRLLTEQQSEVRDPDSAVTLPTGWRSHLTSTLISSTVLKKMGCTVSVPPYSTTPVPPSWVPACRSRGTGPLRLCCKGLEQDEHPLFKWMLPLSFSSPQPWSQCPPISFSPHVPSVYSFPVLTSLQDVCIQREVLPNGESDL